MSPAAKKTTAARKPKPLAAKKVSKETEESQVEDSDSGHSGGRGKSLVIVESPTKARTLVRYLGGAFRVMASGGHVIDLPQKKIGVDIEHGFAPQFEMLPGKEKIIQDLTTAAKSAHHIYIATDPDREGEAIAWHIRQVLQKRKSEDIFRVQFHEITRRAVLEAIEHPGQIDQRKVDAQFARRIMDRLVGYQVSPLLWKTVTKGLSAGRVQSVALRMICEREAEIVAFVSVEYWTIDGSFRGDKVEPFLARLVKYNGDKPAIATEDSAKAVSAALKSGDYRVADIKTARRKRQPYAPFITSTMQQDAGRRLGFTVKRTMSVAQQLYEGVELGGGEPTGLITYMRTDSIRVADEAVKSLRDWIAGKYGTEYLSASPRIFKNKKGAIQDAHEAIRPTDVTLTPDKVRASLSEEQFKLYDLIWRRFVATQMREAELDVTTVTISDRPENEFRASGQVVHFPGFLAAYADVKAETTSDDEEPDTNIPKGLVVGMSLRLSEVLPKQHFTQPPARFSEASLVKELDEQGIGRPSTYATIISTLIDRKYVLREKRSFSPTDLGKTVNHILVATFPLIFNVKFTAQMEDELDKVEEGAVWQKVLEDFYSPFSEALKAAEGKKADLKKETFQATGKKCPDCGGDLVIRWGKRGRFISCSNFPTCKYSDSLEARPAVDPDIKCPKCGSPMMVRDGRFGRFLGCTTYPACKGILPLATAHACAREGCKGKLVERRSKTGKIFFGCNTYPECKFSSWNSPVSEVCPQCGSPTTFVKRSKAGEQRLCERCEWKGPHTDAG